MASRASGRVATVSAWIVLIAGCTAAWAEDAASGDSTFQLTPRRLARHDDGDSFIASRLFDEPQQDAPTNQPNPVPDPTSPEAGDVDDSSPFSFNITYCLFSDYVFRGLNLSEYRPEGREDLNHQATFGIDVDVAGLLGGDAGSLGTFTYGMFFEWFAGQIKLDGEHGGQNLQEVDYGVSWAYDLSPIQTTLTLGYNNYTYPHHMELQSSEWTVQLDHNDAWLWKSLWPENEDGILNPYFLYVHDIDFAAGGKWFEWGVSHDFPVMENLTLTPTFVVAAEHHYLSRTLGLPESGSGQLAYLQYGINAGYNLSTALGWPESVGSWVVSGFLYFNEAVGNLSESNTINDELFGGVSLGWSF